MNSKQRRAKQSRDKILPSGIPSEVLSTEDIPNADYSEFSIRVEIPQTSYAELNSTSSSGILNWEEMLFEELPFDLEALLHSPEQMEPNLQMDQNNHGLKVSLSNATSAGQNIVSYNIATSFDVDTVGLNSTKSLDDTELNMDVNTLFLEAADFSSQNSCIQLVNLGAPASSSLSDSLTSELNNLSNGHGAMTSAEPAVVSESSKANKSSHVGVDFATQTERAGVENSSADLKNSVIRSDQSTQIHRKATRKISRRIQVSAKSTNKGIQVIPSTTRKLPDGVTISDLLAVLRQTPDAGPSILTGRLLTESTVMPSDRPTIQLLFTVMAAAQRDMLSIIDGLIETTRQQHLTPDIALNVCRRRLAEFWNRPLPEDANN
jgi:hypothetical protein